jgi:hypothetical protein
MFNIYLFILEKKSIIDNSEYKEVLNNIVKIIEKFIEDYSLIYLKNFPNY